MGAAISDSSATQAATAMTHLGRGCLWHIVYRLVSTLWHREHRRLCAFLELDALQLEQLMHTTVLAASRQAERILCRGYGEHSFTEPGTAVET